MQLTQDQQKAYDLVTSEHKDIFITGRAGCGKTKVLHSIYKELVQQGYIVITVAFTGRAAMLLPGEPTTISRNVGIRRGTADYLPIGIAEADLYNGTLRKSVQGLGTRIDQRWYEPKLAIMIDEAGQLSAEEALLFYQAGMYAREKEGIKEKPLFIFSADFGQMQPVSGTFILEDPVFEYWESSDKLSTITIPSILKLIEPTFVQLNKVVRQDDPKYLKALRWAYYGIAIHPVIVERLNYEPPPNTPRVVFNNKEVVEENNKYIDDYLKSNPKAKCRTYPAIYNRHNFLKSDLNHLLPVTPELVVAEGMVFMVTENVPYPDDPKRIMVANGEQVTVTQLLPNSIEVKTRRGDIVELPMVQHSLPTDGKGNQPTFLQLPGYVGTSMTLYKVQGSTIHTPTVFGAWCWIRGRRKSLKSYPGCLYVLLSRNTKLDDIYFDTSFGKDTALRLLRDAACSNPIVDKYLLTKPPLWASDYYKEKVVLELESVANNPDGTHLVKFVKTNLITGDELAYILHMDIKSQQVYYSYSNNKTCEFESVNLECIDSLDTYKKLATVWLENYSDLTESV